jgi:hypothetical protein
MTSEVHSQNVAFLVGEFVKVPVKRFDVREFSRIPLREQCLSELFDFIIDFQSPHATMEPFIVVSIANAEQWTGVSPLLWGQGKK